MSSSPLPLQGRVIAIPETRQMEVFAKLLEARGARVIRCPLVAIKDALDPGPVGAWIDRLASSPPELIVFYTGEGVRRLATLAERTGRLAAFVSALSSCRKLCRGPKPRRALRELELTGDIDAASPTTEGIIETLGTLALEHRRVAVQLYSSDPPQALARHIESRDIDCDYVSPYVYASESEDARVSELIASLGDGEVDAIAFTSKAQVERLLKVAGKNGLSAELESGLSRTKIAAVGPIVASELRDAGLQVDAEPERNFFLKPLVMKLCEMFATPAG